MWSAMTSHSSGLELMLCDLTVPAEGQSLSPPESLPHNRHTQTYPPRKSRR